MSASDWLRDLAWAVIGPHLPNGRPGAHRVGDRRAISGILHVLRSGCRSPEFGPAAITIAAAACPSAVNPFCQSSARVEALSRARKRVLISGSG